MAVFARVQSMEGATSVGLPGLRDKGIAFDKDEPFAEWARVECGPNGIFSIMGLSTRPYIIENTTNEPGSGAYGASQGRLTAIPPADGIEIRDSWSRIKVAVTCVGEPLPNAQVELLEEGLARVRCKTNSAGEAVCLVPADADWDIRITEERIAPKVLTVHSPSMGEQVLVQVKATPLTRNASVLLRIRSGSPATPLSNARLTIQMYEGNGVPLVEQALVLQDPRGECLVEQLPPGPARITVDPNGPWNHFRGMLCLETIDLTLKQGERTIQDVLVRSGGMIRVSAHDITGAPITARIELWDSRNNKIDVSAFLETDTAPSFYADSPPGSPFLLLPILEDGHYSLTLTRLSDGSVQTRSLRVDRGGYADVTFDFP